MRPRALKAPASVEPVARPVLYDLAGLTPLVPPASFLDEIKILGIEFEPGELESLGLYLACLYAANESMNLTAIKSIDEAWHRHILDSLTLLAVTSQYEDGSRVIDVGTGGGLPGIPLAIVCSTIRFSLLEVTTKKAAFLRDVVARLGLKNVDVIESRAEVAARDRGVRTAKGRDGGTREAFDLVVARAVARLPVLLELCAAFAKLNGKLCFIKGEQAAQEVIDAMPATHLLKVVHVDTVKTATGTLVAYEKRAATPRDYPRADGEPARCPLKGAVTRTQTKGSERVATEATPQPPTSRVNKPKLAMQSRPAAKFSEDRAPKKNRIKSLTQKAGAPVARRSRKKFGSN